ncbi:MAG: acylneuraminate cytidylyltransferase family protein [Cyclobacteriaceae bacterium]|nr:acylneuraminate cytidylyltransferase family protein [Cyclobacteriaceae bacterium]
MSDQIAVFLPTRTGSQRVKDKNTKPFGGFQNGLLGLKLKQLLQVDGIVIYLSTNDPLSKRIAADIDSSGLKIKVIDRPNELCLDSTLLSDLIDYVPSIIYEAHILWTHVTSPLIHSGLYQKAIDIYLNQLGHGFDSLMTVRKLHEFLWSAEDNDFVSFDRKIIKWPRTQDIKPLFQVNSGIFLAPRKRYLLGDRIGDRPYLLELNSFESMDIDWNEDFELAELIYERANK